MEESILVTIKKMLGMDRDYRAFDTDVIVNINSSLSTLRQLGVGPKTGFRVTGDSEIWSDYIGNRIDLESIKQYIYIKARIVFDPPPSMATLTALKEEAKELESRINYEVDTGEDTSNGSMSNDDIDRMMGM